jgi:hypothetical protein
MAGAGDGGEKRPPAVVPDVLGPGQGREAVTDAGGGRGDIAGGW